ncbi:glycosyltransferase family A protein [Halomonas sp. 11-S5]|uniref:glycosyltransferase family 2 protein n=1 Tax=Halomonas sp. 11-S5 TaxID=2994064 RepID=UPI00246956BA|nr:glycosyltransferase family A protein [Halomonas sp. 11-S5]
MPKFSVVIPVFNKVSTLSAALACLYHQTHRDFEIIAVDDGSTDGSLQLLLREEGAGRLRLFQRGTPGPGGYAARNHGAGQARAEWLVFFDADDLLLFDHLSRFSAAITQHADVELFVNAYQKLERGRRLPRLDDLPVGVLTRQQALAAFARCDFIHMNGACLHRERFRMLGGFPAGQYRRGGDVHFWLRTLCALERIHYDDTVTSLWQLEHSGVTRDTANLIGIHPCQGLLGEIPHLSRQERRQLATAVNRKVLSWAVEKRRLGLSVDADLKALTLTAMRPRLWYHVLSLWAPRALFEQMHSQSA